VFFFIDKMDFNEAVVFFIYKGQYSNNYDKLILTTHWALINFGFVVKDKNEEVTNYFLSHLCLLFSLYYRKTSYSRFIEIQVML
jgi:hypothetical protein